MFHRWVIQREISRALVLNLSGEYAVLFDRTGKFCLDSVFVLIEGHPLLRYGKEVKGSATRQTFSKRELSTFENRDEALNWLVQPDC